MPSISLIGPSGVGKGSHAAQLAKHLDLDCCITGDLLRNNLANRTAVGFMIQRYLENGEHVPDHIVDAVVAEWLYQLPKERNVLFVGYPRTQGQAESLDILLKESERQLNKVIYLEVSDETVTERLAGRILCANCKRPYHHSFHPPTIHGICDHCSGALTTRAEDIPELIKVRLRNFRRTANPMLAHYAQSFRLLKVDANPGLNQVRQSLSEMVNFLQDATAIEAETVDSVSAEVSTPHGKMISPQRATNSGFDLLLLGGPGSGKGTQAEQLRGQLNLPHIATGDLFRENLNNDTNLGRLAKLYMDKGALVPDDVTEAMVEERLTRPDTTPGFILDGFPRTIPQAYALTEILNTAKRRIKCALYIHVSDEEIVQRLSGRLVCRGCQTPYHLRFKPPGVEGVCDLCNEELYQRDDDNPNTVSARLETFHKQTGPIINYYRENGLLHEIDGEGTLPEVIARSIQTVNSI